MAWLAPLVLCAAALAAEPRVEIHSRGTAQGEAVLIVARGLSRPPTGSLAGVPLSFVPGRSGDYLALAGIDLEAGAGSTRLELALQDPSGGPHFWSSEVKIDPKAFPTQELKVDDRFVRLSPEDEARADRETEKLKRLFAVETPALLARGKFLSPIPGALSARFGERRVFNGLPKNPHTGADLKAKQGEPVRAPASGKVVFVGDLFFSGNTVVLDHGLGIYTLYAHLSRVDVVEGQTLRAGEPLGLVGATGRVTGPHLHWAARVRGARVDPFSLTALPLDDYL
jgi:murein DD-endopeptidase MepM/ murein hydrolase activator NlpD